MNLVRMCGRVFLRINERLWKRSPRTVRYGRLGLLWGRLIFFLIDKQADHLQLTTTYFFRNRPELRLLADISASRDDLRLTVIGCSEGAEVFSIIHTILKARPNIKLNVQAFDISETAIDTARQGHFPRKSRLFKYTNATELEELFEQAGETLKVKAAYRKEVCWHHADPTREPTISELPKQDIVFINRLLFHMSKTEAERCLRAAASLVRQDGHIFVSGVDLDLRSRVAREQGWLPITDYLEEIHSGDETMTEDWPFRRWGLEPLDKRRKDWALRYCSVFQITSGSKI